MEVLKDVSVQSPTAGVALIFVSGAHTYATTTRVVDLLNGLIRENDLVVADFCSARFIDLTMLRALFAGKQTAHKLGKEFRIQMPV